MTATDPTAADLLRTLSPEAKEELLIGLLRELIELQGGHRQISFDLPGGEYLGYFVPPELARVQAEASLAEMPPKVREAMTRPLPPDFDPDDSYTAEELDELSRQRILRSR